MSLLKRIEEEMIKALKSGDSVALNTLRGLKSDIRYSQIEQKSRESTDEQIIAVISSAAKKRRDSIEQFKAGGRQDLVDKETKELEIILRYLPQQMSSAEIETIVKEVIAEVGAGPADLGKVMKALMPKVKGKADGRLVSETVNRLLAGN